MKGKQLIWIGAGALVAWYFLFKNTSPEPSGQTVVADPQTGETSGSGWDILGLLGSVSMD